MIKILLTLKSNEDSTELDERALIDQEQDIIKEVCKCLKTFLEHKVQPMTQEFNIKDESTLKITWYK